MGARRKAGATAEQELVARDNAAQRLGRGYWVVGQGNYQENCYSCVGLVEAGYDTAEASIIPSDQEFPFITPLGQFQKTVPVDEISVRVGESIQIPVRTIVKKEMVLGDHYEVEQVDFTALNLPPGSSYNGRVFAWVPQYTDGDKTLTVQFQAKATVGGTPYSVTQSLTIRVTAAPNQPPHATNDSATTLQDTSVTIDVLANDSDPNGNPLTITAVSAPHHGTATIQGASIRYAPSVGYLGSDGFTYTVSDGSLTAIGVVGVIVNALPPPASAAKVIASGWLHSCALTTAGGVKCWGYNYFGGLGDGTTTNRSKPVDVSGLTSSVQAIATGSEYTCALTTGGGVKCWGYNSYGQLGDGTTTDRWTPVDVNGLTSGIKAVATGFDHACALTISGGVKCWGYNYSRQLGDGTTINRLMPVDVSGLTSGVQAISAGASHTCALTISGGVKCWGANDYGGLGDGTTINRWMPVDVSGLTSGVQAIAAGLASTCALTTTGGVKCWGWNDRGQLGDGTTFTRLTPVDVSGLASGIQAIGVGWTHTCAVTMGGAVKCWGWNKYGGLGDGTTTNRLTPVDVSGLNSVIKVVAAGGGHTCALTTAGGVKCWGGNDAGQLGDGTTTNHWTPVDVSGLTGGVQAVAAGGYDTCALTTAGGAKCWGFNALGQLGDGTTTDRWTPVDVSGLTSGVQAIAAGGGPNTCALTTGGGVKCSGRNNRGQLGDGTTTDRSTPVDVIGLNSSVQTIVPGGAFTLCADSRWRRQVLGA